MLFRTRALPRRILSALALLSCIQGCASGSRHGETPIGTSSDFEPAEAAAPEESHAPPPPPANVVQKAQKPFQGYRLADGKTYRDETFLTTLAAADVVCVGEEHDDALDHYAELRILDGLLERRAARGYELGLGMEMVRSRGQPSLQAFELFRYDMDELIERLDWKNEWGFPIQYYAPQILTARNRGARLLALGVARTTSHEIAESGLDSLDDYERGRLPELDFSLEEHRQIFNALMSGHPGVTERTLERYYQAQVVWDESMAAESARFLAERRPGRKLLIMAGTVHCHRDAIPTRLERRTGRRVVSVLPVAGGKPIAAGDTSDIDARIAQGYEFQMVFEP